MSILFIYGCNNSSKKNKPVWSRKSTSSYTFSLPENYKIDYQIRGDTVDSFAFNLTDGRTIIHVTTGYLDESLLEQVNKKYVIQQDTIKNNIYSIIAVPVNKESVNLEIIYFDLNHVERSLKSSQVNGLEMVSVNVPMAEQNIVIDIFKSVRPIEN